MSRLLKINMCLFTHVDINVNKILMKFVSYIPRYRDVMNKFFKPNCNLYL